ncbi:tol-pal system-associated acyl-CoA thioesterase [uncultured Sulfitobacter sp.]|uniref:tol-pal system-associated acyl-CoA thioesterase n=1 Tax=uncultured Sulfitobacter sp. TaxID=191468 RepID=UPI0026042015|nr:tol-pal system-associated acyl-CoA thioesterase [uncultured Sulfitobacter sp.]
MNEEASVSDGVTVVHRKEIRVYYEDTDMAGIVYYANYLRFIERARSDWVREVGIDQLAMKKAGVVFAVRRVEADYIAPARYGDVLEVRTTLDSLSAAKMVMGQQVWCGDTLIFTASVLIVCIGESGKPVRLPAECRLLNG